MWNELKLVHLFVMEFEHPIFGFKRLNIKLATFKHISKSIQTEIKNIAQTFKALFQNYLLTLIFEADFKEC